MEEVVMMYTSIFDLDGVFDEIANTLKDSDFSYIVSSNVDGVKEINSMAI